MARLQLIKQLDTNTVDIIDTVKTITKSHTLHKRGDDPSSESSERVSQPR